MKLQISTPAVSKEAVAALTQQKQAELATKIKEVDSAHEVALQNLPNNEVTLAKELDEKNEAAIAKRQAENANALADEQARLKAAEESLRQQKAANLAARMAKQEDNLVSQRAKLIEAHQKTCAQIEVDHHRNILALDAKIAEKVAKTKARLQTQSEVLKGTKQKEFETHCSTNEEVLQNQQEQLENEKQAELARLQQQHQRVVQAENNQQLYRLKAIETKTKIELDRVKATKNAEHRKKVEKLRAENLARQQEAKTRAQTQLAAPIYPISETKMILPAQIKFMMRALKVEAVVFGGAVRDALLDRPYSDWDIRARCNPDDFPAELRESFINEPDKNKSLFRFKREQETDPEIDIWCEPWTDLREVVAKADISLNTFVSDINGNIIDVLSFEEDKYSPYLRLLGDKSELRFQADPVLMPRMLRFSHKLGKQLTDEDEIALKKHAHLMKELPYTKYSSHIMALLLNAESSQNLDNLLAWNLLSAFIPTMPENSSQLLNGQYLSLKQFWQGHLFHLSNQKPDMDKLIAMLLLLPMMEQIKDKVLTTEQITQIALDCALAFFSQFADIKAEDKNTWANKIAKSHLVNPDKYFGLYEQYKAFDESSLPLPPPLLETPQVINIGTVNFTQVNQPLVFNFESQRQATTSTTSAAAGSAASSASTAAPPEKPRANQLHTARVKAGNRRGNFGKKK